MHNHLDLKTLGNLIYTKRQELDKLYEVRSMDNNPCPSEIVLSKSRELDELIVAYESRYMESIKGRVKITA